MLISYLCLISILYNFRELKIKTRLQKCWSYETVNMYANCDFIKYHGDEKLYQKECENSGNG